MAAEPAPPEIGIVDMSTVVRSAWFELQHEERRVLQSVHGVCSVCTERSARSSWIGIIRHLLRDPFDFWWKPGVFWVALAWPSQAGVREDPLRALSGHLTRGARTPLKRCSLHESDKSDQECPFSLRYEYDIFNDYLKPYLTRTA